MKLSSTCCVRWWTPSRSLARSLGRPVASARRVRGGSIFFWLHIHPLGKNKNNNNNAPCDWSAGFLLFLGVFFVSGLAAVDPCCTAAAFSPSSFFTDAAPQHVNHSNLSALVLQLTEQLQNNTAGSDVCLSLRSNIRWIPRPVRGECVSSGLTYIQFFFFKILVLFWSILNRLVVSQNCWWYG